MSIRAAHAVLVLPSLALTAEIKLNPPLARDPSAGGKMVERSFSQDGTRVVMRGDERAGVFELFVAPSDGSAPAVRIHPALPDWADVTSGGAFAAGDRILFLGDLAVDEQQELWTASADGNGPVTRLCTEPVAGGDVQAFHLTPDRERVVYRADQDADERLELYVVPVDASAEPVRLSAALQPLGDVVSYALTSDGTAVVYRADQEIDTVIELWSVALDAPGAAVHLSGALAPGEDVLGLAAGSSTEHVLFLVGVPGLQAAALHGARVDGSAPAVLLSGGLTAGAHVLDGFRLAPGGSHAVYRTGSGLFSTPLAAPEPMPVRLGPNGVPVGEFEISPDGAMVAFRVEHNAPRHELHASSIAGGASTVLWEVGSRANSVDLAFAAEQLVCTTDQGASFYPSFVGELFAVSLDGSGPAFQLGGEPRPGRRFLGTRIVGDDVVFLRSEQLSGVAYALFVAPLDGSAPPLELDEPLPPPLLPQVSSFLVDPAGTRVLFPAAQELYGQIDLYTRLLDASGPSARVSPPLAPGPIAGNVSFVAATADGRFGVYLATQDDLQSIELYSVDLFDVAAVRKLNPPTDSGRDVRVVALVPDDRRVVFGGDLDPEAGDELYVAPLDGSAPALRLVTAAALPVQPVVRTTHDRLIYQAAQALWSVPLDGSAEPLKLSLDAHGGVSGTVVAGARAVYRTGDEALRSVPLDGSSAPCLLVAGSIGGVGGVSSFLSAPDAACVVYRSDPNVLGLNELFSVPIDGSAPAVRLSPDMPAQGDVEDYAIDAASARVVFAADGRTNNVVEIFSVPQDGSATVAVISGPLVNGGDAQLQGVTPSGLLLYVADALVNDRDELFAVPIDGSAPAHRISGAHPAEDVFPAWPAPGGRVVYRAGTGVFVAREDASTVPRRIDGGLSAEVELNVLGLAGAQVLLRSDHRQPGSMELSAATLDGLSPPRHLHAPLVAHANVIATLVAGESVLYLADAEIDGVTELYLARLPVPPRCTGASGPMVVRSASTD